MLMSSWARSRTVLPRRQATPCSVTTRSTLDRCRVTAERLLDCFKRFNVTAELGRIKVPTCMASAELDILKPRRYGEIMHEGIKGSEFHLVPGAGHMVVLEKAAEINTIILGFLAKQP